MKLMTRRKLFLKTFWKKE